MRLIDADAFRKEVQDYVLPITTNNLMGAADAYHRIMHLLDDAPTIDPAPQWIPVTERLPGESDADKDGRVFAVLRREVPKVWHWSIVRDYPTSFTHWMPLPKPPMDGGAE